MNIEVFWNEFLEKTKRESDLRYVDCFHFELSETWANELLRLVLIGKKRATTSSMYAFEKNGQSIPCVGDLNIVKDWAGNPRCVIETKAVTILPFKEITFDVCQREGEDENLESWVEGHRRFFTNEGLALGYEFSEDMFVVFEDFEVVYSNIN